MLDNTRENLTPARVLTDLVHFFTKTEYEEGRSDFLVSVIMFHEEQRETSFAFFEDPDCFLEEVNGMMENGWRPVALEAVETEENDFTNIALEYLYEPTIEDEAIIESMFESTLKSVQSEKIQ